MVVVSTLENDDVGLHWEIRATRTFLSHATCGKPFSLALYENLSFFKNLKVARARRHATPFPTAYIAWIHMPRGLSLEISQAMSSVPEMESLVRHRSILGGGGGRPGPSSTLRRRSRPPARCGRV